MKSLSCGGLVKRPFVCWGGGRSCVRVRLTEYPIKLSEVFGNSRCDQLQRQQTLGKGKEGDWQVLRKTKTWGGRAPFWQERCAAQKLKASQHWSFYCVGDDWTGNINPGRQLLRCWCFREMLNKYYRLSEWPHRGDCLVSLSIILKNQNKTPTHTPSYFSPSLACKKTSYIRKLFQRVSRSESLLIDCTYTFGLVTALREQWKIRHMVRQNIFLVLTACFFLCKGDNHPWWTETRACSLISGSVSFAQLQAGQAWEWLRLHQSGFLSLQPRGEQRWKCFTLLHVWIHLFCAITKMDSLLRALQLTEGSERWTKWLANLELQPYHMIGCKSCTLLLGVMALPLPQQRNLSPDGFSGAGGRGLSSPPESMPRYSPRHDGKHSCVGLLLAIFSQD